MAVIRNNIEKIRQCERLDPKTKATSMNDYVAKTIYKDRKGRMISLGASVCPIILKKSKHFLKKNKDLRNTNLELTDEVNMFRKDLKEVKDNVKLRMGTSCSSSQPTSVPCEVPLSPPNPHLNKKCTLNNLIEARVACGEVVSIDPKVLIHGAALKDGFYKIILSQIFSPTCPLIKPDGSVSTEVSSDFTIEVGVKYLLHNFPLLFKCLRLLELCSQSSNSSQQQIIQRSEFPGRVEAFEACTKFFYGITITLSALNIAAVRCAVEYLQMTEDIENGNLIYKLEVFLNLCLLPGWKDSISTLQALNLYLFSLKILKSSRCIDVVASSVLTHPMKMKQSHNYSRKNIQKEKPNSRGRWTEVITDLESRRSSSASHSSKLRVAKLVDGNLQEIARDVNFPLAKLIALAEAIPDFARIEHDDLYKAIDIYLKFMTWFPFALVDEILVDNMPSAVIGGQVPDLPNNIKALLVTHGEDPSKLLPPLCTTATYDNWSILGTKLPKSKILTLRMKLAEEENAMDDVNDDTASRSSKLKNLCYIPVRPK
ncbi:hypothetical protein GIB67_028630 [Kingdonia uniflora]|uniref:NPH3 domain-containing protein n=1 Tax=Kingdonia uniflora TaxID=39325 RepID=A0A7J7KZS0_9MAGN|nr:hypothetical protein GIB67_028630 [Kingdonia uniflora]